ncbi:septum formation protein Maf [bacterium]|nr:septum formation protein Maf [bacterium]
MKSSSIRLTLVSASPRRLKLLTHLNIPFDVTVSKISERWNGRHARDIAEENAIRKLRACVPQDKQRRLFLAADTVIQIGNHVLGKPIGPDAASRMLSLLSGRRHQVITGLALAEEPSGEVIGVSDETDVLFQTLSKRNIRDYLNSKEWMGKAGAYAIQEKGSALIVKIEGSFSNVVGLPLELLADCLRKNWGDCRFL